MCVSQKELLNFHKHNELPRLAIKKRNMHELISNFLLVNAMYFVLISKDTMPMKSYKIILFPNHVSEDKFALVLSV